MIDDLLQGIAARHPGNLTNDDVTLLILCPTGKRLNYSFTERLWAQLRLFGKLIRAIDPRAERPPLPDMNLANIGGAIIPGLAKRWNATTKTTKS
jgi:hypothetical protein